MLIDKIVLHNYRIYKGENQIVFEQDTIRNIHIVSGFNGFGKTTFLTSLVWCLYGAQMQEVDESFKKRIREVGGYPRFLEENLNRYAYLELDTQYYVEVYFSGVDIPGIIADKLTIRRSYNSGDKADTVQIWLDGKPNELVKEVGFDLFIQDFVLPKEIAKFFFFDAEKITELAENQTLEQKRQLARAYSEVLGIKKYTDLRASLHEQRLKYRRESAKDNELTAFTKLEDQIQFIEDELYQQQLVLNDQAEEIAKMTDTVQGLQEKLIRAGNVMSVEEQERLVERKKQLLDQGDELKEFFKKNLELAPFAIAGKQFTALVSTAAQEKSLSEHDNVETLFPLLADLKRKSEIAPDSISKEQLQGLLSPILGRYEKAKRNLEAKDLEAKIGLSDRAFEIIAYIEDQLHHKYQEEVRWVTREIKRNRYELNEVNKQLSQAESKGNDIIVKRNRENLDFNQKALNDLYTKQGQTKERIVTLSNELNNKRKVREELQKKVQLQEDLIEKDAVAERLIKQLDEFILKIQEQKKTKLQSQVLATLSNLMHKSNFIFDVNINIDNDVIDIDLLNKHGRVINKETLSMGEKQLYATAILQALVSESNFDFPVFIDSPMQKLDATHATNIIKYFYPTVSKQVILLPLLQKEMSVKEFELLEPHVKSAHLIYHRPADSSSTFILVDNNELFSEVERLYANDHV